MYILWNDLPMYKGNDLYIPVFNIMKKVFEKIIHPKRKEQLQEGHIFFKCSNTRLCYFINGLRVIVFKYFTTSI
jgi:hypothetical protein